MKMGMCVWKCFVTQGEATNMSYFKSNTVRKSKKAFHKGYKSWRLSLQKYNLLV